MSAATFTPYRSGLPCRPDGFGAARLQQAPSGPSSGRSAAGSSA